MTSRSFVARYQCFGIYIVSTVYQQQDYTESKHRRLEAIYYRRENLKSLSATGRSLVQESPILCDNAQK